MWFQGFSCNRPWSYFFWSSTTVYRNWLYTYCCYSFTAVHAEINKSQSIAHTRLRWDKGDLATFYSDTGAYLSCLLQKIDNTLSTFYACDKLVVDYELYTEVDELYNEIVCILTNCAETSVPISHQIFFINFGGTKSWPYWNKLQSIQVKFGRLQFISVPTCSWHCAKCEKIIPINWDKTKTDS